MELNGVAIDDTFAEAFGMVGTRLVVTADSAYWARQAGASATGFATSVIACGCEASIESDLGADATPDGRPGVSILIFAISAEALAEQVRNRVGQSILTCPTTACFAGIDGDKTVPMGKVLRYFGDGFQLSKQIGGRRYWRVPVMDGEFLCADTAAVVPAVGGGNIIILADSSAAVLAAAERAVAAMRRLPNIALPFQGGVVRSGSKVGSKYKFLIASTNQAFCPTLKGAVADSALSPDTEAVLEIVIDGLSAEDIAKAMRDGIRGACAGGRQSGVQRISAGNYGGKLGQYHFHLRELMA